MFKEHTVVFVVGLDCLLLASCSVGRYIRDILIATWHVGLVLLNVVGTLSLKIFAWSHDKRR